VLDSSGTYMSGMNTYLLKLSPENLGKGYTTDMDRQVVGSLAGVSTRLRLQDMAEFLADGLATPLAERPAAPLHLLNIAGGPAPDSLNALLVLRKTHPRLFEGRDVSIFILDTDCAGPNFAARALAALEAQGAPLHGLHLVLQHICYDWRDVEPLRQLLPTLSTKGAIVAASSEGGLFEYGNDQDIAANLRVLRGGTPDDTFIAGSIARADDLGKLMHGRYNRAALCFRGIDAFAKLAEAEGWHVTRRNDLPMTHDVRLGKAAVPPQAH
jgi:hypothetical protein